MKTIALLAVVLIAVPALAGGRDGGKKKRDGQDKEEDVAVSYRRPLTASV